MKLKGKVQKWLTKKKATKHELQSLAGTKACAAKCIKAIRPVLHNIINLCKGLKTVGHHIHIPSTVKADVSYFWQWCDKLIGDFSDSAKVSLPITNCFTDAMLLSAGVVQG